MSIEITGPLKYRLQDYVCVLLAVLASGDPEISLQIEPKNGEDALLTTSRDGGTRFLEVQVKGAATAVSHSALANWLAHFPDRLSCGSLLERLTTDQYRSVLFVASGRCSDAVVPHAVALSVQAAQVSEGLVTTATERGMRGGLQKYSNATPPRDKDLARKRRANIGRQLSSISSRKLRTSLHRVLIAERIDEPDILRRIREELVSRHRVVPDRVQEVIRRITEIVVREKRTGVDVLPEVHSVISAESEVDPLVSVSYVSRGEENDLLSRLSDDSALLLTGAPRVGKSSCARNLAFLLQSQGYSVRMCTDIAEAERYLVEPVAGYRAALVDDPLGGAHPVDNASRQLTQLGTLIPKLVNGRRLIVSQAQDRLLQVSRCSSIDQVRTGKLNWVEMGIGTKRFLVDLWCRLAAENAVPADLGAQVADAIEQKQLDLEPGCLEYLAANHDRLDVGASLDDVIRCARLDSASLGYALREEELAPLMSVLAIASTPAQGCAELELAFVLDDLRTDRPGESNVKGTMSSWGCRTSTVAPAPPPAYAPLPVLSGHQRTDLDRLELRRMVSRVSRRYTFSHPFYRAGAESLVDAATAHSTELALSALERALFTIDVDTACAAATNLSWIYRNLNSDEGRQGVVDLAIRGLCSIFPAARDLSFEFLTRRLATLPEELQSNISSWVDKVTSLELSYMEWTEDGRPRIPAATTANSLEVDPFPSSVAWIEVKEALECLDSARPDPVSARDAAKVVTFLEESPGRLTSQMASRLLSFDTSMIRARAVRLWLGQPREDDEGLLHRIFNEQHPAVTQAAYEGVLDAWSMCGEARRSVLTGGLQEMAESPISAAVLIGHLVLIAREEHGGAEVPWSLFEALLPRVLRQLPPGAYIRDERLYDVMEKAIGNIALQSLLDILGLWIDLVRQYSLSGIPSDYILGVSAILISGVPSDSVERAALVDRLLALPGTASRIRVVSDLVDAWGDLTAIERARLLEHLKTGAADEVWLRAAALTRRAVPTEILAELIPEGVTLTSPTEEIISRLPASLLDACVDVFTGHHPVIYFVGAHGSRNAAWESILRRIARIPSHGMFEVAWEWLSSRNEVEEMAEVANELGVQHAERLADLLLERKQRTSGEFMPEVWDVLFKLPIAQEVKSDWLSRMAALAPSALDYLGECKSWIPEANRVEFLSHFKEDLLIRQLVDILEHDEEDDQGEGGDKKWTEDLQLMSHGFTLIAGLVESAPPKHRSTYDVILAFLNQSKSADEALKRRIEERRSLAIQKAHERPEKHWKKPRDWEGNS